MRKFNTILVTGGCGFIGSNFVRYLLANPDFSGRIVNLDKLTYAGNLENLEGIASQYGERYVFRKKDLCDKESMLEVFDQFPIDAVVHFAAESHVDRSILGPSDFIFTNIVGTFHLLEICRARWQGREDVLFHHVSTDEVYGSLGETGYFRETTAYDPRSPYSASKASSDHLVRAYYHTYRFPSTISNCSNNYGPYQFPEKLIPLMILNMLEGKPLPIYGDGRNIRDWLYVEDHCSGIWAILQKGKTGETYNIGGENEWKNLELIHVLCEKMAGKTGKEKDFYKKQITFVKDRAGHDRRYAIDCGKIKKELNWMPRLDFDRGLDLTIDWYLRHDDWIRHVKTGSYRAWIEKNYLER